MLALKKLQKTNQDILQKESKYNIQNNNIVSDNRFYLSLEYYDQLNTQKKIIEDTFKPTIDKAFLLYKKALSDKNSFLNPIIEKMDSIKKRINTYIRKNPVVNYDKRIFGKRHFTFEIIDIDKVPFDFMIVDKAKIKKFIELHEGKKQLPGIKIIELNE